MNQFGLCTEQELSTLRAWTNEPDGATPVFVEGDCRERMAELPANCIHMIVTSPPYPDGHRKPADWGRYRGEQRQIGGQLNPEWVEWLMGWPIGWTDLPPLAMDRFREWWRAHGGCLLVERWSR